MKTSFFISLFVALLLCQSCRKKTVAENGGTTIELSVDNLAESENIELLTTILLKRAEFFYPKSNPVVKSENGKRVIIELPLIGKEDIMPDLFTAHGDFQLMETAPAYKILTRIHSWATRGQLDTLSSLKSANLRMLGYSRPADTVRINRFFDTLESQRFLPFDYTYVKVWGIAGSYLADSEEVVLPLYFLRKSDRNISLTENCEVVTTRDESLGGGCELMFKFRDKYVSRYRQLLLDNIDQKLALCVDDVVLKAPTIYNAMINDSYITLDNISCIQTQFYNALFLSGPVRSNVSVVSVNYHEPK